jgi:hypothetical protein
MALLEMTESRYVGVNDEGTTLEIDDARIAMDAVERLNGRDRSLVLLDDRNGQCLMIGGGNDGRYVISFAINIDEEIYIAADGTQDRDTMLKVVCGGQSGIFSARNCMQQEAALEAAREFVETASRSSKVVWERSS